MLSWSSPLISALALTLTGLSGVHAHLDLSALSSRGLTLAQELTELNASVGGNLHFSEPWERPCFSVFEGHPVTPDLEKCTAIQQNYTDPVTRMAHFGNTMMPFWTGCQNYDRPDQCWLDPNDPTDPLPFLNTSCGMGNIPSMHIKVSNASHVQAAFDFSKRTGVRLTVKNKGHDYMGRSMGKHSLNIWVTDWNANLLDWNESFTPDGCSSNITTYDAITIGTGVATEDVYAFADTVNRTIIGGYERTVGLAGGYVAMAGHSVLSPCYGLAIDNVLEFKIVTPDGVQRSANECQNVDLFWALRGGGGGTFGVVSEATFKALPRMTLQVANLSFPSNMSTLAEWYALHVDSAYNLSQLCTGGHITGPSYIAVSPMATYDEYTEALQPLSDFVVQNGGTSNITTVSSWYEFFSQYITIAEAKVGTHINLGSRMLPKQLFESAEGRAMVSDSIVQMLPSANPYVVTGVPTQYNYTEGSVSATPAWRQAMWHISVGSVLAWNITKEEAQEQYALHTERVNIWREMTPESGAYGNEADPDEPDHEQSFWGENYPRLLEIKRKYDPEHLLKVWNGVGTDNLDPIFDCPNIRNNATVEVTVY